MEGGREESCAAGVGPTGEAAAVFGRGRFGVEDRDAEEAPAPPNRLPRVHGGNSKRANDVADVSGGVSECRIGWRNARRRAEQSRARGCLGERGVRATPASFIPHSTPQWPGRWRHTTPSVRRAYGATRAGAFNPQARRGAEAEGNNPRAGKL